METNAGMSDSLKEAITVLRQAFPQLVMAGRTTDGLISLCEWHGELVTLLGLAEALKVNVVEAVKQQQFQEQLAKQQKPLIHAPGPLVQRNGRR